MQRIFLRWGRPIAPGVAALVYVVVELISPSRQVLDMLFVLVGSLGAGIFYMVAKRVWGPTPVLRVALPVDTLLIAGMTVALGRPGLLALAYFWSIALAALMLGPVETLVNTALAAACAASVPYIANMHRVQPVVVITDALVICLIGGLLSLLPISVRRAEATLEAEARMDAAALAIAERIRTTLDFDEMIGFALEEMQRATNSARALWRFIDEELFFEHLREGATPVDPLPSYATQVVRQSQRPVVIRNRDEIADDPGMLDYFERNGIVALIGYPILEGNRVVGAAGLHDDKPRQWRHAVSLLDRVVPQLQAALAQARLFARQAESVERLEELARLREELIANVSHELRTPLTSTIGFLRTLLRTDVEFPPEQRDELMGLALSQAERLAHLVDDLLELSRIDRGALPLEPRRVDLADVVQAVAAVAPDAPRVELERGLLANVDPRRLEQVLENLVTNAFRHGGGDVVVRGRRIDGRVAIEVLDDGQEIPPEIVPQLFVPFARWSRSEGSGLGLAISRGLVEAHGGTLANRPPAAGRPHAFVVELPAA
jgi:signal transduction histidine kinase